MYSQQSVGIVSAFRSVNAGALLLVMMSCVVRLGQAGFSPNDYGQWFSGDGTYYGWTNGGNCAMRSLPSVYANMQAVAINADQYAGSKSCGACVRFTGNGVGAGANPIVGTHIAYVHDQCPECHHGSLDLSRSGDGRFQIKFQFIPCPFNEDLSFLFEGSHTFYWKVQARGLQYPVGKVVANGIVGYRTQDNFFVMQNDRGHRLPAVVIVVDIMARPFKAVVDRMVNGADVRPRSVQGPADNSQKPPQSPQPPRGPPRRKCVPNGKFCGPKNWFRTSKCCGSDHACLPVPNQPTFRCMRRVQCISKYQACTGYYGRRKKVKCCAGTSCQRHHSLSYSICR